MGKKKPKAWNNLKIKNVKIYSKICKSILKNPIFQKLLNDSKLSQKKIQKILNYFKFLSESS